MIVMSRSSSKDGGMNIINVITTVIKITIVMRTKIKMIVIIVMIMSLILITLKVVNNDSEVQKYMFIVLRTYNGLHFLVILIN